MKLYTKPGACSTAIHIDLCWTGQPFEAEVVDAATMKSEAYRTLNPAGAVPLLVDGDFVLNQNAAIAGYIADAFPAAGLAGDGSARQRAEATRWLSYVNSDLHPAFTPMFAPGKFLEDPAQHEAIKAAARLRVRGVLETAERRLQDRQWLAGFRSFADPYLFVTMAWAGKLGIDLSDLPALQAFHQRMSADPGVQTALKAEGLI